MPESCTFLIHFDKGEPPSISELKASLESNLVENKIAAMKKIILYILNGEKLPQLLMPVIQNVMTEKDHTLKKLLLLYWEVLDKKQPDGRLLTEMILVCNAIMNDLNHPNEYLRGATLRYICKLKEPEILEPLLNSIRNNLENRYPYVKRNAILALYSIFKDFDHLCPDAPEYIYKLLLNETDATCKRNAFLMLCHTAQDKAVEWLHSVLDQVSSFPDILQFAVIDLIRKVCRTNPADKAKFLRSILSLLDSDSPAVRFESAGAVVALSTSTHAIKAAASTYISLLCGQSDNNIKMIVLDKLLDIKQKHTKVLHDLLLDVMRALASPNMDIRKKTLDLVIDLVSPRNIEEVISVLKKEINRTHSTEEDKGGEYRQILIEAIHLCAIKFPDVANSVVHVLMDFLDDSNVASAVDVVIFVREVMESYPDLRNSILQKLIRSLNQIKAPAVFRPALWIIGEYAQSVEDISSAYESIKDSMGGSAFFDPSEVEDQNAAAAPAAKSNYAASKTRVLADGTYSSQSAVGTESRPFATSQNQLQILLQKGEFFLGAVIATTLVKLLLKIFQVESIDQGVKNSFAADILLIIIAIIKLGNTLPTSPIDPNSLERLYLCIKIISEKNDLLNMVYLSECRYSFAQMLTEQHQASATAEVKPREPVIQADDLLKIRQLRGKRGFVTDDDLEEEEGDVSRATGSKENEERGSKLNKIHQLTGFSDPLYAEAYILVHQYDVVLDVLVINQTGDTLQNVSLELATLGDLKLVERPQTYSIAPRGRTQIKANIKVSSTETGIIFGSIVYDISGKPSAADRNVVILNDIHIDIMDYIAPATCTDLTFRSMWSEFEWENKVAVNSTITNVIEFLDHIVKSTNMKCLTPRSSLDGDCGFLAANLYAKSVFGEDALANVCIEKLADNKLSGYVRIRSKTQGIALSLGDKIGKIQKNTLEA